MLIEKTNLERLYLGLRVIWKFKRWCMPTTKALRRKMRIELEVVLNPSLIQGLVRGYLVRRELVKPRVDSSLDVIYSSLGKFNLGNLPNIHTNFQGGTYIGETDGSGVPQGKGRLFLENSISEGTWVQGKLHGEGRKTTISEVYTGGWELGKRSGFGELKGKTTYKGQWENDQPHGKGVEFWPDGSEFEGTYYKGLRHGQGRFTWPDKSVYQGDFRCNCIEGYGGCTWSNGSSYLGMWKNNEMHGKGQFKWGDGRIYEGRYRGNLKHGFGVLIGKNGKRYEGKWCEGQQHGTGVLYSNSSNKQGKWRNGRFCS